MDYSPSLASIVEGAMKSEAGHFEDTVTEISGDGTITLSIPTGITALAGGTLMQVCRVPVDATHTHVSGAEIFFTTDPDDAVCFVKEILSEHTAEYPLKGTVISAAPLGGAHTSYKKDGWLTPDGYTGGAYAFGPKIHAKKVWVDGANIKIDLRNTDLEVPKTVDVFLTYLVFGT